MGALEAVPRLTAQALSVGKISRVVREFDSAGLPKATIAFCELLLVARSYRLLSSNASARLR